MNRIPIYIAVLILTVMFSASFWTAGQEAASDRPATLSANPAETSPAEPAETISGPETPAAEPLPAVAALPDQAAASAVPEKPAPAPAQSEKAGPSNGGTDAAVTGTSPQAASQTPVAAPAQAASGTPVSRACPSTDVDKYPKVSDCRGIYGQFRYRELGGGRIEIDPHWVAENIITVTLPGINRTVQIHKASKDNFIEAFTLIANGCATINGKQVPLASLVETFDGIWVPRHINWDPKEDLSNHSWGAAVDINASDHFRRVNPWSEPDDPNLILWQKAFQPAGFKWGNSYADAMHYEMY